MRTMVRYMLLALMGVLVASCGEQETKQRLIMVTEATFPPYEFYRGSEIVGIDADIVREVARRNNLHPVIEDMSFDSVITAVQSGKADVAASGITVTEDRKKQIDFTAAMPRHSRSSLCRRAHPLPGRTPSAGCGSGCSTARRGICT